MLTKDQLLVITEGWTSNFLKTNIDKFKNFFIKLKDQFKYNSTANQIVYNYLKTGTISKHDSQELKTICIDTLKLVGLGSIAIPIPGGSILLLFLINSAKKLKIDILPSHFENATAIIDYGIKYDTIFNGIKIVLYNKNPKDRYLIGHILLEKFTDNSQDIVPHKIFTIDFLNREFVEIVKLEVSSEYRNLGYAKKLLHLAEQQIRDWNILNIYLNASPLQNTIQLQSLIDFYTTSGFQVYEQTAHNAEMFKCLTN